MTVEPEVCLGAPDRPLHFMDVQRAFPKHPYHLLITRVQILSLFRNNDG